MKNISVFENLKCTFKPEPENVRVVFNYAVWHFYVCFIHSDITRFLNVRTAINSQRNADSPCSVSKVFFVFFLYFFWVLECDKK